MKAECDVKVTQKCPCCGFIFELDRKKMKTGLVGDYEEKGYITTDNLVWQQECPHCHRKVTTVKEEERTKNRPYHRFKRIFTEDRMMEPGFMKHGVTLYNKKVTFGDIGFIEEYKYGNGCWRLHEEYEKTRDPTVFRHKRNALRTYGWCVETTVWNDSKVEFEIKTW